MEKEKTERERTGNTDWVDGSSGAGGNTKLRLGEEPVWSRVTAQTGRCGACSQHAGENRGYVLSHESPAIFLDNHYSVLTEDKAATVLKGS